jgi:hypothetical protein
MRVNWMNSNTLEIYKIFEQLMENQPYSWLYKIDFLKEPMDADRALFCFQNYVRELSKNQKIFDDEDRRLDFNLKRVSGKYFLEKVNFQLLAQEINFGLISNFQSDWENMNYFRESGFDSFLHFLKSEGVDIENWAWFLIKDEFIDLNDLIALDNMNKI